MEKHLNAEITLRFHHFSDETDANVEYQELVELINEFIQEKGLNNNHYQEDKPTIEMAYQSHPA